MGQLWLLVLQGIQLDELQKIMEDVATDFPADIAAKFGRNMFREVGEMVVRGIAQKHGIALVLIGAGTRAPHDNIFLPTDFNMV